ncbi:putative 3-oxo-Delta(4,5)-steroid 5-beta-reductase-like [Capsicum annuum]|nr:putative 3-oxo-Delta(4,5)-steroid 5-beta-reductase-like [Capsicum annuum]KAF3684975.1 putative 3-oxo-Delta(4,5)-steroid 5-beta-reductase-like [Capsicum annuum]
MIFYNFLEPGVFHVKTLCSVFTSVNPVYLLVPQIAPLAYEASNHAILGVAKATARELGQYGIRVNCVSPYGIATSIVCKTYGCDADPLESSITGHANLKGPIKEATLPTEFSSYPGSNPRPLVKGGVALSTAPQPMLLIARLGGPPVHHNYGEQNKIVNVLAKDGAKRDVFESSHTFGTPPSFVVQTV